MLVRSHPDLQGLVKHLANPAEVDEPVAPPHWVSHTIQCGGKMHEGPLRVHLVGLVLPQEEMGSAGGIIRGLPKALLPGFSRLGWLLGSGKAQAQ